MEKVLVCITPQANSHRLIDRAVEETELLKGELHILNIQEGDNIFNNDNSAELLAELFSYGSEKGGDVHALAGSDIPEIILSFVKSHNISKIIVGEPPKNIPPSQDAKILEKLKMKLRGIDMIVVEREKK